MEYYVNEDGSGRVEMQATMSLQNIEIIGNRQVDQFRKERPQYKERILKKNVKPILEKTEGIDQWSKLDYRTVSEDSFYLRVTGYFNNIEDLYFHRIPMLSVKKFTPEEIVYETFGIEELKALSEFSRYSFSVNEDKKDDEGHDMINLAEMIPADNKRFEFSRVYHFPNKVKSATNFTADENDPYRVTMKLTNKDFKSALKKGPDHELSSIDSVSRLLKENMFKTPGKHAEVQMKTGLFSGKTRSYISKPEDSVVSLSSIKVPEVVQQRRLSELMVKGVNGEKKAENYQPGKTYYDRNDPYDGIAILKNQGRIISLIEMKDGRLNERYKNWYMQSGEPALEADYNEQPSHKITYRDGTEGELKVLPANLNDQYQTRYPARDFVWSGNKLWMTLSGSRFNYLMVYDKSEKDIKKFLPPAEMALTDALSITVDDNQNKWIATDRGLLKFRNGQWERIHLKDLRDDVYDNLSIRKVEAAPNSPEIWCMAVTHDYRTPLYRYHSKHEQWTKINNPGNDVRINDFVVQQNKIWAATDAGLYSYKNDQWQEVNNTKLNRTYAKAKGEEVKEAGFRRIAHTPSGKLWLWVEDDVGFIKYNPETGVGEAFNHHNSHLESGNPAPRDYMTVDGQNHLWIYVSTYNYSGFYQYENDQWKQYNIDAYFPGGRPATLKFDKQGRGWTTSGGGKFGYIEDQDNRKMKFNRIDYPHSIKSEFGEVSHLEDNIGGEKLAVINSEKLLRFNEDDSIWQPFNYSDHGLGKKLNVESVILKQDAVWAYGKLPSGSHRLYRYSGNDWTSYNIPGHTKGDMNEVMVFDGYFYVYFRDFPDNHYLYQFHNNRSPRQLSFPGEDVNYYRFEANKNGVWAYINHEGVFHRPENAEQWHQIYLKANDEGGIAQTSNEPEEYEPPHSLQEINNLASPGDSSLWISTSKGVYHKNNHGQWYLYNFRNTGHVMKYVEHFHFDEQGTVWLLSEYSSTDKKERFGISPTLAGYKDGNWRVVHKDGIPDRYDLSSMNFTGENSLWLGTVSNGILKLALPDGKGW